jgi:hypothetical protein
MTVSCLKKLINCYPLSKISRGLTVLADSVHFGPDPDLIFKDRPDLDPAPDPALYTQPVGSSSIGTILYPNTNIPISCTFCNIW